MTNTNDLTRLAEQFKGRADDCGRLARAILATKPQAEQEAAAKALTKKEILDLTSMIWGAPCADDYIVKVITPVIRKMEKLRRNGQRPVDPASIPRRQKGGV